MKFEHLKPGDLITADLMNNILDALNSLDQRIASAEALLARRAKAILVPPHATKRKSKAR